MARIKAKIAGELRTSDFLTLASLMGVIPYGTVLEVLKKCGVRTQRYRKLPMEFMVYYVVCMTLYAKVSLQEVLRCIFEGCNKLKLPLSCGVIDGRGGIPNARNRLGAKVMCDLFETVCVPIATQETVGAFYRKWRLTAIDGSTLDLPDEKANREFFGAPGASRGKAAFPKLRFVALLEIGTHAIFAAAHGPYKDHENTLAKKLWSSLKAGMLLIADRGFGCYPVYSEAVKTGADLLFRVRGVMKFAQLTVLGDGSYLSRLYPSPNDRRKDINGITIRVIEYRLKGGKEKYVLITSILDPLQAPAAELATVYHERWEIEMGYDEIKNHLKEPGECLRSKTPELVIQEFYGYLLTHFTIRSLMHQAALKNHCDPDKLSFVEAVRVICRKITAAHFPPPADGNEKAPSGNY
jgi:hypothetical protein